MDTHHLLLSTYPYIFIYIRLCITYLSITNFLSSCMWRLDYVVHNSKLFMILAYIALILMSKDGQKLR